MSNTTTFFPTRRSSDLTRYRLQAQVPTLTQEYLQLAYAMRSGRLTYQADELVGGTIVDGSQSIEKVEEALLAFLDREEQKVRQRLQLPADQPARVFESEEVFEY